MAINISEFINNVDIGIKANKDYTRFLFRFKIDGKQCRKIFDYSNKDWDKRTRTNKAKVDANDFKESKLNPITEIDENIKMDIFSYQHFKLQPKTKWTNTKLKFYEQYLCKEIGKKKVKDIKQRHIKECIHKFQELGLKARTVKQTIEVLNPIFKEAIANRLITFNPLDGVEVIRPKTKKIVTHASILLDEIYKTITSIFDGNLFYQSLYLFALHGRRKNEILQLKWENIDFKNNKYLVEDTKNGEHQLFFLPENIKMLLQTFREEKGYVYESSLKQGKPISNLEVQTKKIKEKIPKFTLHYMRNVVVSAMAEKGVSATLMSGALGHSNTATLAKYLSLSYSKGSEEASNTIDLIIGKKA